MVCSTPLLPMRQKQAIQCIKTTYFTVKFIPRKQLFRMIFIVHVQLLHFIEFYIHIIWREKNTYYYIQKIKKNKHERRIQYALNIFLYNVNVFIMLNIHPLIAIFCVTQPFSHRFLLQYIFTCVSYLYLFSLSVAC